MRLKIESQEVNITEDFQFFLVLNGSGAGGFTRLGGAALIDDGKLDFLGLKAMNVTQLAVNFFNENLLGQSILTIEMLSISRPRPCGLKNLEMILSTVLQMWMEKKGPQYPLNISVLPARLKIFIPTF